MQSVGRECTVCEGAIRRAKGAAGCAECDVAFHQACAAASAPAAYRETHDSAGTRCPRCGQDAVAREAERSAREREATKQRLVAGRRTWRLGALLGSGSHAVAALTLLVAYLAQARLFSLRALLGWLFLCTVWWLPQATPVATGALGAAGLVVGGVSVIGAVRELAALDADTRALVLVGYGVVALAGAGMALAGLRLATSAEARDYARLVGRRLARRKR